MQSKLPQPIYTTVESVKVRLINKVQFQSAPEPLDGELPDALLYQLIRDGEVNVELTLRSRYKVPFQSASTGKYCDLPDHSRSAIRLLCDLKAVMLVLGTDFGRGTHVSADPYYKECKAQYKDQMLLVLGFDPESKSLGDTDSATRFRRAPPLDDLALAATNLETADNGFRGKIINTDASRHDAVSYAGRQINDPSKTYIKKPTVGGI